MLLVASTTAEFEAALDVLRRQRDETVPSWWTRTWDRWLALGAAAWGLNLWHTFCHCSEEGELSSAPVKRSLKGTIDPAELHSFAADRRKLHRRISLLIASWPARPSSSLPPYEASESEEPAAKRAKQQDLASFFKPA